MTNFQDRANFIWSIADLLRGDYKQAEYGKVILPFTVLRRLDCLLEESKEEVLKQYASVKSMPEEAVDRVLNSKSGFKYFHNHSKYNFEKLLAEPDKIKSNLANYIAGFSRSVKEVFESFHFEQQINRLDKANLLYQLVQEFNAVELGNVGSMEMGYIFEHLIYKFAEASNETAGEHFNLLGWKSFPFQMESDWFSGKCEITTYALEELLGTKLRALYQRKKGRDLFDLYYADQLSKLNWDKVLHCYQEYMRFVVDKPPTANQFLLNLEEKKTSSLFNGDLEGLLRDGIQYDQDKAFEWMEEKIESMEDWKV